MKDMYEWMLLTTKARLAPGSVISRLSTSMCSIQAEVRSDRTRRRRSTTPYPRSYFYSSSWPSSSPNMCTTPSPSRDLSVLSDDLDSFLNYSRSSTSPTRYYRGVDRFSTYAMRTSTPVPKDKTQDRSDLVISTPSKHIQVISPPSRDIQVSIPPS